MLLISRETSYIARLVWAVQDAFFDPFAAIVHPTALIALSSFVKLDAMAMPAITWPFAEVEVTALEEVADTITLSKVLNEASLEIIEWRLSLQVELQEPPLAITLPALAYFTYHSINPIAKYLHNDLRCCIWWFWQLSKSVSLHPRYLVPVTY
jgi:hypothetical protein